MSGIPSLVLSGNSVGELNKVLSQIRMILESIQLSAGVAPTGTATSTQLSSAISALQQQINSVTAGPHGETHSAGASDQVNLDQSQTHGNVDTDAAVGSLHHTLGGSANQAAPGNHAHSGTYEPANANIQAHIASTSNPHGVTAAQAGAAAASHTHAEADITNLVTDLAVSKAGIFDDIVAAAATTVTIAAGQQMFRIRRAKTKGRLVIHGRMGVR